MKVELLAHTIGTDELINNSLEEVMIIIARESSEREDKGEDIGGLLKYLTKHKHWSPFEHASFTVRITTSRAIAAQFLRHRSFSFQELSQRYAVVGAQEPLELRKQCDNNRQSSSEVVDDKYLNSLVARELSNAENTYQYLIKEGVARESARMVLPMNTQTRLVMTGSVRSWIHFFEVRCDEHTQKEARGIAEEIRDEVFKKVCPITYGMLYPSKKVGIYPSKGMKDATLKVGDLVTVHDCVGYLEEHCSLGDVGMITEIDQDDDLWLDFNNQGNPKVFERGRACIRPHKVTKLDISEL